MYRPKHNMRDKLSMDVGIVHSCGHIRIEGAIYIYTWLIYCEPTSACCVLLT